MVDRACVDAPPDVTGTVDDVEGALLVRVLDALLREDHLGLRSRGARVGDGWWATSTPRAGSVLLPVRDDGLWHDPAVRAPRLVVDGAAVDSLDGALDALAPAADDAEAAAGWAAFRTECAAALATARLPAPGPPAAATGFAGLLGYEALAALREHPVHPVGRARVGMSDGDQRRFAPEFRPTFRLGWVQVPRARLRVSAVLDDGGLPGWWWPADGPDRLALPVHPATLAQRPDLGPAASHLDVTPTLSMRTVALVDRPDVHLKLPLPVSTLGLRNRRTIRPGTLPDGATVQRLLEAILRREPALARGVLLADESRWVESDDELLAALVRHYPDVGDDLVPLAALAADDPRAPGATVLDRLAAGDPVGWFARYLDVLLDWHVALWLRYGVALEAHQQNVAVATGDGALRLVYKDNDGARVDLPRLAAALGPEVPVALHDARMAITEPAELADVFVTLTLNLCVAAPIADHTAPGSALRVELLELARTTVERAVARWCDPTDPASVAAATLLRAVLAAENWPVKAMVTAGTLLPKHRLGCTDVNKHYVRTGRNYLRHPVAVGG